VARKHPKINPTYAKLLPPLRQAERDALAADIAERGVMDAIVCDANGDILDGHHRFRIAPDCPWRVLPGVESMSEEAKIGYVLGTNNKRRNMTAEQKAEHDARRREVAAALREQEWTLERIAALLGVDERTVRRWDISNRHPPKANIPSESDGDGEAEPEPFDARRKVSANEKHAVWEEVRTQRKSQKVVAAEHGITQGRVSQIVKAIDERKAKEQEEAEAARKAARRKNAPVDRQRSLSLTQDGVEIAVYRATASGVTCKRYNAPTLIKKA